MHFQILYQHVPEAQGGETKFPQEVWDGLGEFDTAVGGGGGGDAKSRYFRDFFKMHSKFVFH